MFSIIQIATAGLSRVSNYCPACYLLMSCTGLGMTLKQLKQGGAVSLEDSLGVLVLLWRAGWYTLGEFAG